MNKKCTCFMLSMVILLTFIPTSGVFAKDINNDMILVNTEVFMVEDD